VQAAVPDLPDGVLVLPHGGQVHPVAEPGSQPADAPRRAGQFGRQRPGDAADLVGLLG
jgi:hypothetical protein